MTVTGTGESLGTFTITYDTSLHLFVTSVRVVRISWFGLRICAVKPLGHKVTQRSHDPITKVLPRKLRIREFPIHILNGST